MAMRPAPPTRRRGASPDAHRSAGGVADRLRRASGRVLGLAPARPAGVRVARPATAATSAPAPVADPSGTFALLVDVPDVPEVPGATAGSTPGSTPGSTIGADGSATFALIVDVADPSGTFALIVDVDVPAPEPDPDRGPGSAPALRAHPRTREATGEARERHLDAGRGPARTHPATHPAPHHTRQRTRPAGRPGVSPGVAPGGAPGVPGVRRPAGPPLGPDAVPMADPGTGGEPGSDATPDADCIPSVDPRIHARRVAVQRAEGRRRLRILVVLVGLLTVATAFVAAVYSPMLDVERVDVAGVTPDLAATVRQAAGVSRGDALLRVSTDRVAQRLEQLPFIAHATVSRDLPDTVHITVTTRQTIAWVKVPPPKGSTSATTAALVDATGTIVNGVLFAPSGLPELVGLTTKGRPGTRIAHAAAAHVAAILPAGLRTLAATLSVRHGLVTMGLAGGPEIRFGTPDDLAAKGRTALAVLGALSKPVHYVDVRVPTAPVTG